MVDSNEDLDVVSASLLGPVVTGDASEELPGLIVVAELLSGLEFVLLLPLLLDSVVGK